MGHPRSRRSGHHLLGAASDLLPAHHARTDPAGGDGGGASRLAPVTHAPAPHEANEGVDKDAGATTSAGDAPEDATRSHLRQEGPPAGHLGVTVMPFGNELSSGVSLILPSVSSVPQLATPPSGTLRSVEESSSLSRHLNYTLQTEGDVQEHPLLSSPPAITPLHAGSPFPHHSTTIRGHGHHTIDASTTPPDQEDTPRTHTPADGDEGAKDPTTPTTSSTTRNQAPQLPHTTTTSTTTTRRTKRTTREPRGWTSRTQRSAPSRRRLVQPAPAHSDPNSVCKNNPCGMEPACHVNKTAERGFVCLCDDESVVEPMSSCHSRGEILNEHPSPKTLILPKESGPKNAVWPIWVSPVLIVAVLLFAFWRRKSLCAWARHRHREKKTGQQSQDTIPKSDSLVASNSVTNPNYYTQGPDTQTVHTLPVHLIHPKQIAFIGELGEGCFGKVYKGTYTPCCPEVMTEAGDEAGEGGEGEEEEVGGNHEGIGEEGGGGVDGDDNDEEEEIVTQTVAVKVIKESVSVKGEEDFMREVEIMSAFSHPNILTLIGIVAKGGGGTPWMVFEYMPYGDLAELLRSCGPNFYSNHTPVTSLSKSDLLHISVQIASGMEYLSSQHFVHRDLACRNCLVGEDLTVKISDFGMSRDVYTCDYYKVGGSRMLPVRWMAPESIMYGKFTLESDVWSFGVVLWEIYSFGKQPYYGNSNENVVKLIFQGILLCPPDTCPPQVCDVMRRCWATDPTDRLNFPEILAHLKGMRGEGKGISPHDASPQAPVTPCGPPVTYSQLCLQEEAAGHLDQDLYLVPRRVEPRDYITVLNV